eukprot:g39665.t1
MKSVPPFELADTKTKELVIDFRKRSRVHAPVCINGAEVEMVNNTKVLGVTITNNLSWTTHIDTTIRKAQQHLYFLKRLRKFNRSIRTLSDFYRSTMESILTRCITAWYGNSSAQDCKKRVNVVEMVKSQEEQKLHLEEENRRLKEDPGFQSFQKLEKEIQSLQQHLDAKTEK